MQQSGIGETTRARRGIEMKSLEGRVVPGILHSPTISTGVCGAAPRSSYRGKVGF